MSQFGDWGAARDPSALRLDEEPETLMERAFAAVLVIALRLWCLPFLVVAWLFLGGSILVGRGVSLVVSVAQECRAAVQALWAAR